MKHTSRRKKPGSHYAKAQIINGVIAIVVSVTPRFPLETYDYPVKPVFANTKGGE